MGPRRDFVQRVRLVALALTFVGALLIFRLYDIQVVKGATYRDRAETQYALSDGHHFDRGSIFFTARTGSLISAATLETGYTVALIPRDLIDAAQAFTTLSSHLALDSANFFSKASK